MIIHFVTSGYPYGADCSVSLTSVYGDSYTDVSVGDEVVVYFDENIMETDPLQLGTVYAITLRTPANRVGSITMPDEITEVEVSGYYNGGVIQPGDFVVEDFDEFEEWFSQLSLEHRTFEEGKNPGEMYAGGDAYTFDINDGALTFTYAIGGSPVTEYIIYDEEWYEVLNPSELPFK